jgi:signal transduction histidine kinase
MIKKRCSHPTQNDPAAAERRLRILLVEDDALVRAVLLAAAQRAGFDTAAVGTGREALECAQTRTFDLAVLDYRLPDCSGTVIAESLRRTSQIPFVFLTANADDAVVAEAAALGALAYLVKPFDPAALGPTIRIACARAADRSRVIEHERQRLASELHDGLGQELTAASLMAAAVECKSRRNTPIANHELTELRQTIEEAQRHCRDLSHREYANVLRGYTLGLELQALTRREAALTGVECIYEGPTGPTSIVPDSVGHHLYRVAQEAIRNAIRHSGGSRVTVQLSFEKRKARMSIRDNGRGCSAVDCADVRGIGCLTMRYRAISLGGTIIMRDAKPSGTEVVINVPTRAGHGSRTTTERRITRYRRAPSSPLSP